jgi:hypothetical protein
MVSDLLFSELLLFGLLWLYIILHGVYATFMQKLSLTYYTHNYAPPLPEPSSEKS